MTQRDLESLQLLITILLANGKWKLNKTSLISWL